MHPGRFFRFLAGNLWRFVLEMGYLLQTGFLEIQNERQDWLDDHAMSSMG